MYADDYRCRVETYLARTRQVDVRGRRLSTDAETEGRRHSAWLNMMYPRLRLSRDLLRDDGVLLASIDDTESAHLRRLLDEVFGEDNFVAAICHKARGSVSNDVIVSPSHNTVYVYARNREVLHEVRDGIGREPDLSGFDHHDARGAYRLVPVDGPGGARKGNPHYEFLGVEGCFRYSRERMQELYEAGEIVHRGHGLQRKCYRDRAERRRRTDTTWWDDAGYTSTATSELRALMGGAYFDSPKPVGLVERMIEQFTDRDSLVLDFFAGSGTTGHAVMSRNARDGGTRRFVLVQLPEPTPRNSEAHRAGFSTITEITRRRLRLAGDRLLRESASAPAARSTPLDVGFRVYRLAGTCLRTWDPLGDVGRRTCGVVSRPRAPPVPRREPAPATSSPRSCWRGGSA